MGYGPARSFFIISALILAVIFLIFPLIMGTKTYPIAIVDGNSMYPNLQNGDLIIFHSVSPSSVTNGSIIVFVQGQTGISMVDSLIRPVVIHRVNDIITQYNGVINFRTKGDNNKDQDPELVQDKQLLGQPVQVVPKIGLFLLFIRSSQGMIATVGFISLFYLGNFDSRSKGDDKRGNFIGILAQMVLNHEISREQFNKFEVAVKYANEINVEEVSDGDLRNLIDWVRSGGLEGKWKIIKTVCPICNSGAIKVETDEGHSLTFCESCDKDLIKASKYLTTKYS